MASTLTRKEERVVENMVRIAGSERAFEDAIVTLQSRLGRPPTGDQLLDYLLDRRIEQIKKRIEYMEAHP